jgi:hypothetical protein
MLLGFKRRFEGYVKDRSKRHTIRANRKRRFRVGDRCDCYVDSRQKSMRLLGRWLCVKVEEILIEESPCGGGPATIRVFVEGMELDRDERNRLAWSDGFRSRGRRRAFSEMADFWIEEHGKRKRLHFRGQIIHWNPDVDVPGPHTRKLLNFLKREFARCDREIAAVRSDPPAVPGGNLALADADWNAEKYLIAGSFKEEGA